tara:strand:- start:3687 stop:4703 length:1017 start_codon:yes stop_codon:yes gene_type:complete
MEGDVEKKYLRRVFTEVIRGFSKISSDKYDTFYIKHIDVFDSEEIDEKNEEYLNYAKNKGLPTEKQRLEQLKEDDLWSVDKQKEIDEITDYIKQLKLNKSKYFLKAQIDSVSQQIKDENEKLLKLIEEKFTLVGLTAEIFASKKINEYYIFNTLYKKEDLKNKLFTEEQFDELSEDDLLELIKMFNYNSSRFSQRNLKRIALSPFFLNDFYLCEDSPMNYFGKPLVELTYNQSELFSHAKQFKYILQELKHRPSAEVMSDPDKLIEVYEAGQNAEKVMSKMDGDADASTVVGATKEDLERLGLKSSDDNSEKGVDLAKEAAKKGGNLDMEDLIKLHGL